jgi:cytidine deaminase
MTKLTMEEKQQLIRMALAAREKAYAPYSDFMVGAALRAADGRIFTGCNVENAAFTPTSCAERTALFKAVAEGVTEFTDIAVVGSRRGEVNRQITSPCGVCRQALFEFGGPELNVIMAKPGRFHRAQHGRAAALRLWPLQRGGQQRRGRGVSVLL